MVFFFFSLFFFFFGELPGLALDGLGAVQVDDGGTGAVAGELYGVEHDRGDVGGLSGDLFMCFALFAGIDESHGGDFLHVWRVGADGVGVGDAGEGLGDGDAVGDVVLVLVKADRDLLGDIDGGANRCIGKEVVKGCVVNDMHGYVPALVCHISI